MVVKEYWDPKTYKEKVKEDYSLAKKTISYQEIDGDPLYRSGFLDRILSEKLDTLYNKATKAKYGSLPFVELN